MKLRSLAVNQFKQFTSPTRLDGIGAACWTVKNSPLRGWDPTPSNPSTLSSPQVPVCPTFADVKHSRSPVVWNIGFRQADAFFIKTFSPQGADFNGEYCVDIE